MMRKLTLLLLSSLSFINFNYIFSAEHLKSTPLLEILLGDMKLYKLDSEGDQYLHAGDVYEHSIWTYNAMVELLESDLPYTQDLNLNEREKEVVSLAALLHDIGKTGRKELFDRTHPRLRYDVIKKHDGSVEKIIYYQDRQEHPRISFEYAAKPLSHNVVRNYYCIDTKKAQLIPFDMCALYEQLGVEKEEQKVIAILLGIHYEFGNYKHGKITAAKFLSLLEDLAKEVEYNNGAIDERIVRLSILIQAADVKGLTPVSSYPTSLFPQGIACEPVHQPTKFDDAFKALGYIMCDSCCSKEPVGVEAMNNLLSHFKNRYKDTELDLAPAY